MRIGRPQLAVAATVTLWASAFTAIRSGLHGYNAQSLSMLRVAVASAALALVAPFAGVRRPARRDLPAIVVCGATGVTAYQLLLNTGEQRIQAGTASLLIATAPLYSLALAVTVLRNPVTRIQWVGSAIALCGIAVIALSGDSGSLGANGYALVVLAAAVVGGIYHAAQGPLLSRYTGLEVASYATWAGTVLALPLLPSLVHHLGRAEAGPTTAAVYLGVGPSAIGFVTWAYAVSRLGITRAAPSLFLIPAIAIVVAIVWLGEIPRASDLIGGGVAIVGVVIASRAAGAAHAKRITLASPTRTQ